MNLCTFDTPSGMQSFSGVLANLHSKAMPKLWVGASAKTIHEFAKQIYEIKLLSSAITLKIRDNSVYPGMDLSGALEDSTKVRDRIQRLLGRVQAILPLVALAPVIEDALSDWDEIVEDLSVSCDGEIRLLVGRLAGVVNARQPN